MRPVEACTSRRKVLKAPPSRETEAEGVRRKWSVRKLRLAPNAPAPLELVPTPRCNWASWTLDEKLGILAQKTPWLSESLSGTPLVITLIPEASTPRTLRAVYPMPIPASLVATTDGVRSRR